MQLKSIIIIVLIFMKLSCSGQTDKTVVDKPDKFYIIIEKENEPTVFATFLIMDTRNAMSERFIKKEEVGKLYPNKIKKRTLLVKLKSETNLISMKEIYNIYHISDEEQKLSIVVDDTYIKDTENILADKDYIVYVETQIHPMTKQRVLYIRTKATIMPTYKTE